MKLCLGILKDNPLKTEHKTLIIPSFEVLTTSPELNLSGEDCKKLHDWLFNSVNLLLHPDKLQLAMSMYNLPEDAFPLPPVKSLVNKEKVQP